MGWKNVRDHYRIEHIVTVHDTRLHIGSPCVPSIIVVAPDGTVERRLDGRGGRDLQRYQDEIDADPVKFAELLASPDTFGPTVAVFTWEGADIVERRAEDSGWPNVTTDGHLMHDNRYSTDRAEVVAWALDDAEHRIALIAEGIEAAEAEMATRRQRLAEAQRIAGRLREQPVDASKAL